MMTNDRSDVPPSAPMASPALVQGDMLGLRDLLGALMRRRRLIAAVAGGVALLFAAFLFLQPKTYEATTLITLEPRVETAVSNDQPASAGPPDMVLVESQVGIITSPFLVRGLVDALDLTNDPKWNSGAARLPEEATVAQRAQAREVVVANVLRAIRATRKGSTYNIEVTVKARDPQQAATMANTLVDLYLNAQTDARLANAERAGSWFTRRLDELERDTREKEAAVAQFRAQAGLLDSAGVPLNERQISEVQAAVISARTELADKEARYAQVQQLINSNQGVDTIAGVLNSTTISDLRQQEAEISRRQAEYSQRYGERHPSVRAVRTELENIRRQIDGEVQRISSNFLNEVQVARARVNELQGQLANARGQLVGNNQSEVQAQQLEREAAAARTVYQNYLQRYMEISQRENLGSAIGKMQSAAAPPTDPSNPGAAQTLVLALALGLIAGLVAGFLAEQFDDGVNSAEEIERRAGLRVLTSIPALREKDLRDMSSGESHPAGFLAAHPMSALAESFRVLRTSVMYASVDRQRRIVAVTSPLPDEGKTTTSLCLGRIAAMAGQRVLLVDCDLRRRSVNGLLDIAPKSGLLQVLAGEMPWRQVVGADEVSDLHILPVADSAFTPIDVFSSEAMKRLVAELTEAYDLVILDCPPVLTLAETRTISQHADSVVLVGRWRRTTAQALAMAKRNLENAGARVLGVALNLVDVSEPGRAAYSDPLYLNQSKSYYTS